MGEKDREEAYGGERQGRGVQARKTGKRHLGEKGREEAYR
jgi:hypothetical protein